MLEVPAAQKPNATILVGNQDITTLLLSLRKSPKYPTLRTEGGGIRVKTTMLLPSTDGA